MWVNGALWVPVSVADKVSCMSPIVVVVVLDTFGGARHNKTKNVHFDFGRRTGVVYISSVTIRQDDIWGAIIHWPATLFEFCVTKSQHWHWQTPIWLVHGLLLLLLCHLLGRDQFLNKRQTINPSNMTPSAEYKSQCARGLFYPPSSHL